MNLDSEYDRPRHNEMFKQCIQTLKERGLIKPKILYFAPGFAPQHLTGFKKIARQHQAKVVDKPERATHVCCKYQ